MSRNSVTYDRLRISMPIYEYTCKACNTRFDHLAKSMNETGKVKCPECKSARTERAMSVFAVASSSAKSSSAPASPCGRCGMDGSCPMQG